MKICKAQIWLGLFLSFYWGDVILQKFWAEEPHGSISQDLKEQNAPENHISLASRKAWILAVVARQDETQPDKIPANFFWASALFELNRDQRACEVALKALETMAPDNTKNRWRFGGNSGFTVWPGMDCYIKYQHRFNEQLKKRYREIYTGGVFYPRLSTSNHKIMAAVTRYLATQVWGEKAFVADKIFSEKLASGNRFSKDDPSGEKYVRSIIESTMLNGPGEYASMPYGAHNILPLLTIAECAADDNLKASARAAYEYSLSQLAPAWLAGHIGTFSPRSYPDALNQQPWGLAAVLWVYFGGVNPAESSIGNAIMAATSNFYPSEWIIQAATDRSKAYVYRAFINGWCLYHYITPSYAMFSRSAKAGGKPFSGQSYPCGLKWVDTNLKHTSQFWVTCPAKDSKEGTAGLHTHGVNSHAQELQFKNAMLYVFNIPSSQSFPYALAYIPGGWLAMDDSASKDGRILLHYKSVVISIQASQPFSWEAKAGIKYPATPPREGDSEFRIMALRSAVAVEARLPSELEGSSPEHRLKNFRTKLEAGAKLEVLEKEDGLVARYTSGEGHLLECGFGGEDHINGQKVDYAKWPQHESPWKHELR